MLHALFFKAFGDSRILVSDMEACCELGCCVPAQRIERGGGKIETACMIYCNQFGLLAESANANAMLEQCKKGEN